jgi:hypothetical protein
LANLTTAHLFVVENEYQNTQEDAPFIFQDVIQDFDQFYSEEFSRLEEKRNYVKEIVRDLHVSRVKYTRKNLNLSTRCVRHRFVASLSTSCNNAVISSSC